MKRKLAFGAIGLWWMAAAACGGAYSDAPTADAGVALGTADSGGTPDVAPDPTPSLPQDVDASEDPDASGVAQEHDAGFDAGPKDAGPKDAGVDANDAGPPSPTTLSWTKTTFTFLDPIGTCTGAQYIAYLATYDLWVGVRECSKTQYKILLSKTQSGTYYDVADGNGAGEDHCEFVSPGFHLPNDDDITSGGCSSCALGAFDDGPKMDAVFWRAGGGKPPTFVTSWPTSDYSPAWYKCGVSIP